MRPVRGSIYAVLFLLIYFYYYLAVWLSASPVSPVSPRGLRPLRSIRVISQSLRLQYCFALFRCVSLPMGYFVCFYSQFLSLLGCVLAVRPVRGITWYRKLAVCLVGYLHCVRLPWFLVFCYCKWSSRCSRPSAFTASLTLSGGLIGCVVFLCAILG